MKLNFLKTYYRKLIPLVLRDTIANIILEKKFHYDAEIEFYGAYKLLLKNYAIEKIPYHIRRNVNWSHGWYSDFFFELSNDPYLACQNNYKNPNGFTFVTRKTQQDFLEKHGFTNVMAIGMPIVYLPEKSYIRTPNSLLVMPGHSLEGEKIETFEDEYVDLINSFRQEFKKITICVHPGCKANGYWMDVFKMSGYKVITGVGLNDTKAFNKLQKIMSEHEYMTTNCYGSHIMYASYFGSKVSIIGRTPIVNIEDALNNETWRNEKDKSPIIETFKIVTMSNYRKYYPSFFVDHPLKATNHKELADYELGVHHKIGKNEFNLIFNELKAKTKGF